MRAALFSVLALCLLAGCATVAGIGEDVSNSARTVQGWFN